MGYCKEKIFVQKVTVNGLLNAEGEQGQTFRATTVQNERSCSALRTLSEFSNNASVTCVVCLWTS
jgi:hypothetical protein